jgi:hypothetical protein
LFAVVRKACRAAKREAPCAARRLDLAGERGGQSVADGPAEVLHGHDIDAPAEPGL